MTLGLVNFKGLGRVLGIPFYVVDAMEDYKLLDEEYFDGMENTEKFCRNPDLYVFGIKRLGAPKKPPRMTKFISDYICV